MDLPVVSECHAKLRCDSGESASKASRPRALMSCLSARSDGLIHHGVSGTTLPAPPPWELGAGTADEMAGEMGGEMGGEIAVRGCRSWCACA